MQGSRALQLAAAEGQLEIVQKLLRLRVDHNKFTVDAKTPLELAAENGHLQVVQLLLKADQHKSYHFAAIHLAVRNGHPEVVQCLLQGSK